MKIFRVACADMIIGGILKKRYFVMIMLCAYCSYVFHVFVSNLESVYGIREIGLGDMIAFVHCGTIPGIRMIQQREFELSYMWLTLIMLHLFLPLDYPLYAMENWGYPYIVKSSRKQWWLAKCIYTLMVNLIGISMEIVTFLGGCLISGFGLGLKCHSQAAEIIFGSADGSFSGTLTTGQSFFLLIVAPMLGIMAMSMVLLLLSVTFGRVVAYVIGAGWIFASVFAVHPLLPGNCTMAIRSSWIDAEGMGVEIQVASCLGIVAAAMILGILMIRRKDFFFFFFEE